MDLLSLKLISNVSLVVVYFSQVEDFNFCNNIELQVENKIHIFSPTVFGLARSSQYRMNRQNIFLITARFHLSRNSTMLLKSSIRLTNFSE